MATAVPHVADGTTKKDRTLSQSEHMENVEILNYKDKKDRTTCARILM